LNGLIRYANGGQLFAGAVLLEAEPKCNFGGNTREPRDHTEPQPLHFGDSEMLRAGAPSPAT